ADLLLQDRPIRGLLVGTDAHLSLAGRDPLQRLEALAHLLPRLAPALLLLLRLDRLELLLLPRRQRFPRRKRADGRVQDAAAGHVHEQRDRDRLQAPVGLEGLELVEVEVALPGECAPAAAAPAR